LLACRQAVSNAAEFVHARQGHVNGSQLASSGNALVGGLEDKARHAFGQKRNSAINATVMITDHRYRLSTPKPVFFC
jgi:hypothetical protein